MSEGFEVFKILQENFEKNIREFYNNLTLEKELISGNSSAFGNFVADFRSKFEPFLKSLTEELILMEKEKEESQNQNFNNKITIDVFSNSSQEMKNWIISYNQINKKMWEILKTSFQVMNSFSITANQSFQQNQTLHAENIRLSKENTNSVNKIASLKYIITKQYNDLLELSKNNQILSNIIMAFNKIGESGALTVEEYKKQIETLKSEMSQNAAQIKEEFDKEISMYKEEISTLKSENESSAQENERLQQEKESLEENLKEKDRELLQMSKVVNRNTSLETAINELCQRFPFITFDGKAFDCKTEDIQVDKVIQLSLDNKDKTIREMTKDKQELQRKILDLNEKNQQFSKVVHDREDEKCALLANLKEANKKIKQLQREKSDIQARLSESENDRKKQEETIEELSGQIAALRPRFLQEERNKKEKDDQRNAIKELASSIQIQKPRESFSLAKQALNLADPALKMSNDLLRKEKSELEKTVAELRQRLQRFEGHDDTENEIDMLKRQLEESNKRYKILDSKMRKLISQYDRERSEFNARAPVDDHPPPEVPIVDSIETEPNEAEGNHFKEEGEHLETVETSTAEEVHKPETFTDSAEHNDEHET